LIFVYIYANGQYSKILDMLEQRHSILGPQEDFFDIDHLWVIRAIFDGKSPFWLFINYLKKEVDLHNISMQDEK